MPATSRTRPAARLAWSSAVLIIAAAGFATMAPTPAWSQAAGQSSATAGPAAQTAPGALNRNLRVLPEQDRELMEDLAHANLGEIETGRLAVEKSQNEATRSFAQRMIDDHTAAYRDLQQLAQRKGVQLPGETDFQHKAIAVALKLLSGETFDNQYMEQVGVNDHRRTVDLLEKVRRTSTDADLKAHAEKTLPIVQRHLATARQMSARSR